MNWGTPFLFPFIAMTAVFVINLITIAELRRRNNNQERMISQLMREAQEQR